MSDGNPPPAVADGQQPRPAIGHQYWFDFSRTLVDGAISRRELAAEALQKLVIWIWGVYTAAASVGFALSGKELTLPATVLIALPSALLILVYWGTVWVQMPRLVAFDPRVPDEIEQAHRKIVEAKERRLMLTLLLSVVTAAMVSLGLVVASVGRAPRFTPPSFRAELAREGARSRVAVTAHVGQAPRATLRVTPLGVVPARRAPMVATLIPDSGGLLQASTALPTAVDSALVELGWEAGDGLRVQVSRKASVPPR
ncbi:MAG: hypothetical protein ACJ8GN_04585 [Longimicrobiaceae bacterium]